MLIVLIILNLEIMVLKQIFGLKLVHISMFLEGILIILS